LELPIADAGHKMNFQYISLRFIRHLLPEQWAAYFKHHRLFIQPGLETVDPAKAVEQYRQALSQFGIELTNKKVMVFGYGGNITIGCELIVAGAEKVFLVEQKGFKSSLDLSKISFSYPSCFSHQSGIVIPNPQKIIIFHDNLNSISSQSIFEKVDLVLSNSVFEHLREPLEIVSQLAEMTSPLGSQLHFIDLRDHFFKYPFEMLCYSNRAWDNWLNPSSHLNRMRLRDYQNIFIQFFNRVEIITDERDMEKFNLIKNRIRPEFLSGNEPEDCTTRMHVFCSKPR